MAIGLHADDQSIPCRSLTEEQPVLILNSLHNEPQLYKFKTPSPSKKKERKKENKKINKKKIVHNNPSEFQICEKYSLRFALIVWFR
jgi:hypothetical protein